MQFTAIEDVFGDMTALLLGADFPADHIRLTYPADGQPGWGIDENVVFLRLFELESDYAKQLDSFFVREGAAVVKKAARTIVWEVQFTVYGPQANEIVNKIKDGVFRQDAKRQLAENGVFLIPNLPPCKRVPELFAGQWWNRWDLSLQFNQLHRLADEDAGSIESASISVQPNR